MALRRHKNLDEAVNERAANINIDERIASIEEFQSPEHRNHYVERVFMPSLQEMYGTIDTALTKAIGGEEAEKGSQDDNSVYGKEEEIMKATVAGLKKHFAKVKPSLVAEGTLEELGGIKEQYTFLTAEYDNLHGGDSSREGRQLLSNIHLYANDKDAKVHDVMGHINMGKLHRHAQGGYQVELSQHATHQLHGLTKEHLHGHVKGKLDGEGYQVKNNLAFRTNLDRLDYVNLAIGLKTGDFGTDNRGNAKTLQNYFIEKKSGDDEE